MAAEPTVVPAPEPTPESDRPLYMLIAEHGRSFYGRTLTEGLNIDNEPLAGNGQGFYLNDLLHFSMLELALGTFMCKCTIPPDARTLKTRKGLKVDKVMVEWIRRLDHTLEELQDPEFCKSLVRHNGEFIEKIPGSMLNEEIITIALNEIISTNKTEGYDISESWQNAVDYIVYNIGNTELARIMEKNKITRE